MPTTQTTVQFEDAQIQETKFWYEKLPYTYLEPSLGTTNPNTIFNVNSVATASLNSKVAILSDISLSQVAGVNLQTQHGANPISNATQGYPALNSGLSMGRRDQGVRSINRLGLSLINTTGAAQANFQCNYAVAVKQLSTADKILYGMTLNAEDQQYASKFNLHGEGKRPLPVSRILDQYVIGQIVDDHIYVQEASSVTSSPQTLFNFVPNSDEIFVIKEMASSAPVGNLVQINVTRDAQKNYCQVLADNMTIDTPLDCWIPAAKSISVSIQANTTTSNVLVRLNVLRIRRTPYIQILFGLVKNPAKLTGELAAFYEQVQAGVWS